ncbi:MAG: type II toxin-antitoxin system mRNA interferase toxin, RelE/StbE family [bacterium]|nr:type II toxin-antitoxin system mRNA interferase toxin, RelE/StbE family [bacterium]
MNIYFTKNFKKAYKKRIEQNMKWVQQFEARYDLFADDPTNPVLRDHALIGNIKGYRSFSVTGDIRVIYYINEGAIYFVDIGTHNQIY